ncbi:MAG: hypothetical protein QOH63_3654 [Acidobacteriota bacterium]|jgi:hypothetical protein|nr:hypothetical protein [Acidobacteriota bacterium]
MQFAQICDRVEIDAATVAPIDHSALLGTWVNSNPETNGIERMLMTEADGKLILEVHAIGPEGLINWGKTDVTVLTSSPMSRTGAGFTCLYDFGFAETRLQAMIMKGLTVLAQFHIFKDDSRRIDYFAREYYALAHGQ